MPVNDPLFSEEAVDQYTDKKSSKQDNSKKTMNGFAIFWINARFSWKRL